MNDPVSRLLFLAHLASSLFMLGLIWFVQVVHYPFFDNIGRQEFTAYEQRHTALTTWVVAPAMLIEATTAVPLIWFRPSNIPQWSVWTGLALVGICWLSTAFIQVPCHELLSKFFDPIFHQRLVSTNWLRTAAWSVRAGLVLWLTWSSIR